MRFEYFLTLLKHCDFLIGNSSAGIREAGVYGIPSIDIGTRQLGRYDSIKNKTILHVEDDKDSILQATYSQDGIRVFSQEFGDGISDEKFLAILEDGDIWSFDVQKRFRDYNFTGEKAHV